jgi:hypothetical protein
MPNIRRLYVYAVSLVSLEVVLWGSIALLRSLFASQGTGGSVERLAGALSLIFVGIPVFILHWSWIQRSVAKDEEERFARLRAIFLYLVLLLTLVPITQNIIAFLNRSLLQIFALDPTQAIFGGEQVWSDNLVAILVNSGAAIYFSFILQKDWRAAPHGDAYPETRRLFRYLCLLYSLALVVFGLQQSLQFLLSAWDAPDDSPQSLLANGLALLLVGLPIWLWITLIIQRSLAEPAERDSLLRLVVLYLQVFASMAVVLVAAGVVIYQILLLVFGASSSLTAFLVDIAIPFSLLLAFGLVLFYYGRSLSDELRTAGPAPSSPVAVSFEDQENQQRRAALRRLYFYILALASLAAGFAGLQFLFASLLDLAVGQKLLTQLSLRNVLAAAIAAVLVAAPVWFLHWRPVQKDASRAGEPGDYARRSLVRKSYLYLVLFAGVLGVMFSAGALVYQLLRALLGDPPENLLLAALQALKTLLLFAALLVYHWLVLRRDNRFAELTLARRYAQFPVLILANGEDDFGSLLSRTIEKHIPGLPVAVHDCSQGAPDASLSIARAVILPAELAVQPGEALRLWLQNYSGERLVVATPSTTWYWLPPGPATLETLARQATRAVRQLAEHGKGS